MPNTAQETGNYLWQLPIVASFKSMSYCIKTADGSHFVIDGGDAAEAEYLENFINEQLDGRVDAWFITHPHKSHVGAFEKIIAESSVTVNKIVYSYHDPETVSKREPKSVNDVIAFNKAIKNSKIPSVRVKSGDRLKFGKCIVKIIVSESLESDRNHLNDRGVIYKFNFKTASILFLGDVGRDASFSLLSSYDNELKSDILQMAHHGYYGVSNELYDTISPNICLWPTRKEMWQSHATLLTNESKELESTYAHMCANGVEKHYVAGIDELTKIEF